MKKLILNIFLTAAIFLGMMMTTGVMQKQLIPVLKLKKELTEMAQTRVTDDTLSSEKTSPTDSASLMLKEIEAKKEKIATRLTALQKREEEISQREQKVEEELAQLKGLREELQATTSTQISKLAKAFQAMDANQAAKIAGNLDDHILTDLLLQIRERNAAKILAALAPPRAARIYKLLSNKNLQASGQ